MLKVVLIYIKFLFVIILEVHTFYFEISIASVLILYRMWEGIIMYAVTDYSECRTLGHGVSTASWLTPQARISRTCVLPISQPCQLSPGRYGKHVLQTKTDSRLPLSVKTSSLRNDDIWVTRLDRSAVSSVNEVSAVLLPNSWLLLILFVS